MPGVRDVRYETFDERRRIVIWLHYLDKEPYSGQN